MILMKHDGHFLQLKVFTLLLLRLMNSQVQLSAQSGPGKPMKFLLKCKMNRQADNKASQLQQIFDLPYHVQLI